MAAIDIYTIRYCPYCCGRQGTARPARASSFHEIDVTGNRDIRKEMIERANGRSTFPQIFIGATHVGGCDDLYALEEAGKLDPLLGRDQRTRRHERGKILRPSRSAWSRCARGSIRRPISPRLLAAIDEAKRAGADYVLTPEMTNILELKREQLFAKIVAEEHDPTLATLREVARKLSIYIHIGSLAIKASPDKAANRSFLIDRKGDIAARYDKIHMFDVDLAGGESYRESNNYRPGELAVVADLPWGRLGLTRLLRPALPGALSRAGRSRRFVPGDPVGLHQTDRRGALARAAARPRHRERLLRVRRRARRQA